MGKLFSKKSSTEEHNKSIKTYDLEEHNESRKTYDLEEHNESRKTYDIFRSFVEEGQLNKKMESNGEAVGLCNYIKDSLDIWKAQPIKIAVSGHAGSGKSTLINALANMENSDKGAAKAGVTETTQTSKEYKYPGTDYVTLSDLPGYGTKNFPNDSYFKDTKISTYDVVIVVISERFLENDAWLADQFLQKRENVLFVRTKIDQDVKNEKVDRGIDFNKNDCLERIRREIIENLSNKNVDDDVFLVSSRERKSYDFEKLEERLKEMINIRGRAISEILKETLTSAIKKKQANQENKFRAKKVVLVATGFFAVPFLETGIGNICISSIRKTLLERFSLDEKSLEKICEEVNQDKIVHKTKTELKKQLESYQDSRNHLEFPYQTAEEEKEYSTFQKYSKYILPVVGSFMSAFKSYKIADTCLVEMCNKFANDELKLVEMRLKKLEKELERCKIAKT